jgi:dUTP pyrophosphatase
MDKDLKYGVPMEVLRLCTHAKIPTRGSAGAAGYDLSSTENVCLYPGSRALISTGIAVKLPQGVYGRVAPRSGLAVKHGIHVGAGVVDSDYRGEIKVLLFNHSDTQFQVNIGDRIAQLICEKYEAPEVTIVTSLDETSRGEGGFGSTGTK